MQQLLNRGLVSLGHSRLEFVSSGPETRSAHQVSHQSDVVLVCHRRLSSQFYASLTFGHGPPRPSQSWQPLPESQGMAGLGHAAATLFILSIRACAISAPLVAGYARSRKLRPSQPVLN